jgi:phosphatidylinositol alpha-1,6-mannosyltransferase
MTARPDLLLTFDFPPIGGGISRLMSELAMRYPPGELIVSTGQVDGSGESDRQFPGRIDRLALPSHRLKTLQGLILWSGRVRALARDHDAKFILCGNLRPAAYPAKWLRETAGLPYGVVLYGGDLLGLRHNYLESRAKRLAARTLLASAEVLVAISRWTHDLACEVLRELGLADRTLRVRVIPMGADPALFTPGLDAGPLVVRHRLPPARWLVTVARLVPHKGVDVTIRALRLLVQAFPDLHYAIVGEGSYQPSLESLAQEAGVADRVHFLTDVRDAELPLAYALADVYVGVSRQTARDVEGFGISLLEAQASATPVVAGRSGGMPDAVREGETGLLTDPEDPAAVAASIASLLREPGLAARLGAGGRRAVERYYNWNRVVDDFRALSVTATPAPP